MFKIRTLRVGRGLRAILWVAVLVWRAPACHAGVPAPERLLPEDTLVVVTAPDFVKFKQLCLNTAELRVWSDEAMRPFREKLVSKWQQELAAPLERELKVNLESLAGLPQGQVTFALTQNGWQGRPGQTPAWLVLADTKDRRDLLATNLAALRKRCVEAGKLIRSEKLRGFEFSVLPMSSLDVPKALNQLLPHLLEYHELGNDADSKQGPARREVVIGQAESLLIAGNSVQAVEKVVLRLSGGALPVLGDLAAYNGDHQAFFRNASAYAWINARTLADLLCRWWAQRRDNPDAPTPAEDIPPERLLAACGLTGLKTIALSLEGSNEGLLFRAFFGAPEATRQGLLKLLAGQARETSPPPFVPANTVNFERWRFDGPKTWTTLEKILADLSPQSVEALSLIFDTAQAKAREKEPGYDLKQALLGNLGDDLIVYEKPPRDQTPAELGSPPSIALLGSPNPEQLAAAFQALLVILPGADAATEREFLGRKIRSVPLPASLPLPLAESARAARPASLHYSASRDYVALSTDASLLEEYLRSNETQGKALREIPGLAEAAQKVTGPGTAFFGYENRLETTRAAFEAFRADPAPSTQGRAGSFWLALLGMAAPQQSVRAWLDVSLLPPFARVGKYFHFAVSGTSASVDGLTYKLFLPTPPALGH